jgi:hypothetical protein
MATAASSASFLAMQFAHPANRQDLRLACGIRTLGHQRHLAVIVDEAGAGQALVSGALVSFSGWK